MRIFFISYTQKLLSLILTTFITIAIIFFIFDLYNNERYKRASLLEIEVEKYLEEVYSINGEYPQNLEYLTKVGLVLDEQNYHYNYEYISKHKKPNINVVNK